MNVLKLIDRVMHQEECLFSWYLEACSSDGMVMIIISMWPTSDLEGIAAHPMLSLLLVALFPVIMTAFE